MLLWKVQQIFQSVHTLLVADVFEVSRTEHETDTRISINTISHAEKIQLALIRNLRMDDVQGWAKSGLLHVRVPR